MKVKKSWLYIGALYVLTLMIHRIPHRSYSILEYLIKPINIANVQIYLSSIVPLLMVVILIKGLLKCEDIKDRNHTKVVLFILLIVLPLMYHSVGMIRSGYHQVFQDNIQALDIVDVMRRTEHQEGRLIHLRLNIEVKDYGKANKDFKIRMKTPSQLRDVLEAPYIYLTDVKYGIKGRKVIVDGMLELPDDEQVLKRFNHINWYKESTIYELYDEHNVVKIIWRK